MATRKSRSWLRFSLRAVFAAVTVSCIAMAWYAYQANKEHQVAHLEKAIRSAKNGDALRDYQVFGSRIGNEDIAIWARPFAVPQIKLVEALAEQPDEVPADFAVAARQARFVTMHGAGFDDGFLRDSLSGRTEVLQLFYTSVSADGFHVVKRCPHLQKLTCWTNGLAPGAIDALSDFPKLSSFTLKANIQDLMMASRDASSDSLQEVVLHLTPDERSEPVDVGDDAFAWLERMPQLKYLSVYGKDRTLDDAILCGVCRRCPHMEHLTLVKGSFSAEALAHTAELGQLKQLDISDCGLSAKDVSSLPIGEKLECVSFLMNPLVDAEAVRALKSSPRLKTVKISGRGGVIQTIDVSSERDRLP